MENLNATQTQMSYADVLRETQQEEFPLLSEVTCGVVEDPISLMNSHYDDDGVVVPCALPDTMWQSLPQMMSEPLSLYDDADIRTMLEKPLSFDPRGHVLLPPCGKIALTLSDKIKMTPVCLCFTGAFL